MERVQREERRHKRAAPPRAGHALQEQKQEDGVENVQGEVGGVEAGGIQSIKIVVHHEGEPGQWMPVVAIPRGKRPTHAVPGQPGLNLLVLDDIERVVVIKKFRREHPPIGQEGDEGEEQADAQSQSHVVGPVRRRREKGQSYQ